ncbi:MAG TPA: hypothetical protein VGA53_00640 [Candidatus Paceibacterota bacterium]
MKTKEKNLAIKLRRQGYSINDIYRKLGVGKGSVSLWVRNIPLTEDQKQELSARGTKKAIIEKRRTTRLSNESARRQKIVDGAKKEIIRLSKNHLFLIGVALYWGEGGKTKGIVRFSNSDPHMIQVMMNFFKQICKVPEERFRGYIHIHPHLDHKEAERYWSQVSGIPLERFYKTYRKPNKASTNQKDSLPFGTFDVYICSTELLLKLKGWTEKIVELSTSKTYMPW